MFIFDYTLHGEVDSSELKNNVIKQCHLILNLAPMTKPLVKFE